MQLVRMFLVNKSQQCVMTSTFAIVFVILYVPYLEARITSIGRTKCSMLCMILVYELIVYNPNISKQ